MKKYILPFVILLVAMSITSCSNTDEDSNEISILGEWTKHSEIDVSGNETIFTTLS